MYTYTFSKSIPLIMDGETNISPPPTSQILVSQKNRGPLSSMDFNFLVRPTLDFHRHECQTSRCKDKEEDGGQLQSSEEKQEDNFDMFVSSLKVQIPSAGEFCRLLQQDDNVDGVVDDEGLKTPTSLDHKITVNLQCPPAPRKPKSLPLKKRKGAGHPRILLHLSSEIESLFPPVDDLLADVHVGGKIKKKLRV
ncbi:uncharacterized protein LOC110768716 [Prunus avium]|uniref:Uncharacterized protein LOC110768716 n=1 Tax=Prunus avium TaxID=42229 RepID=A0A6P5TMG2_PRUAV|nr:uncharacterized protein LOC110768716 [Prunus avium]